MIAIPNIVSCKRRKIVTLLWPLTCVMSGTPPVTAHSQESVPAQVVPASRPSVASQPFAGRAWATPTLRSLTHPFPPPAPRKDTLILTPYSRVVGFSQPAFPVASGGKAVWYSTGVNQIHCSLLLPNSTWLGTECGLKRLDNKTRTTRHFCALDGLPYNRITALAGQEQQLYCCAEEITADDPKRYGSEANPHRSAVALCRYHADSGKWERVAAEMRHYPQGIHLSQPEQSKVTREYVGYNYDNSERQVVTVGGDYACLVLGPGMPGQELALISPLKGGDAQTILCPSFAKDPFRVSFAHADQESLWIGSDLGLLRYDFKARRWDRLLSDLVVTGGCPAEPGALWLLTRRFDPVRSDKDGSKLQTEHWQITHFVPGKPPEHFAILDHENREKKSGGTPYFANIVASEDKVWTTELLLIEWGAHAESAYYPAVYSLNLNSRQVALDVPFDSGYKQYQPVPDALLAHALTGAYAWTPTEMPERFPGWTCPAEENDHSQAAREVRYAFYGADDADGRWYTERESVSRGPADDSSRHVLKHVDNRGAERESFPFPAFTVEAPKPGRRPDIDYRVVAVDHNAVWIIARGGKGYLFRFDRGTHAWINIPAQDGVSVTQYNEVQWRADGTSCWLNTPTDTYRLDLKTQRWQNISARLASGPQRLAFQQVIPDGEDVWLVPAGIDAHNTPLAQPLAAPLYRYHIKTDTFVPVQPSPGAPLLPRLLTVNTNSVLFTTEQGNFRFDRATNRWNPLPSPTLPTGFPPLDPLAIYEERGTYWFTGKDSSLHLKK